MRDDPIDLHSPSYTPVRLINEAAHFLRARSDHRLALILEMEPAQLSRIRHRKEPVSDRMMVQIMDRTGWHIQQVRELAGMPYDGAAKLVLLAQKIGKRFPHNYTVSPEPSAVLTHHNKGIEKCQKT